MTQGGKRAEEGQYVFAPQGLGEDDLAICVHRVDLEDVFRQIEANGRHRV